MIKKILIRFLRLCRNLKWFFQAEHAKHILPTNIESEELKVSKLGNVLILVPHSDDEWISCSGVIEQATSVTCLYFDYTRRVHKESNSVLRLQELMKTCDLYGVELITQVTNNIDINRIIQEKNINTIFTPSPYDWHDEHIKTYQQCIEQVDIKNVNIVCYHVSVPFIKQKCFYIPMTKGQQKHKWEIFSHIYKSQTHIPVFRFKLQERLNGYLVKKHSCELFYNYKDFPEEIILSEQERNTLKQKMNNIYELRRHLLNIQEK